MSRASRRPKLILLAGFVIAGAALAASMMAGPADAHGSTQVPASRVYTCRFENPNNPMCAAAWSANSQALYDWMEVNIGDAGGRHRELIADGQLCSAGREKYAAFDQPGGWPVTALQADGSGRINLVYQNTAPHSTEYYRVYITRSGFDARTDALAWSDLELAYDSGPLGRAPENNLQVPLPSRDVPAILYVVWQRSDSPEAFYACSDVTVSGGSTQPPTPSTSAPSTSTTSAPPTTSSSTTSTPATTAPPTTISPTSTGSSTTTAPPGQGTVSPTSATQTSVALPAKSDSTVTKVPTSAKVATSENGGDEEAALVASGAGSTGPSTPQVSIGESAKGEAASGALVVADAAEDGSGSEPSASASADDAGLVPAAAPAIDAGAPAGGQRLVPLAVVGFSSLGLVLLGAGVRYSDEFRRVFASIGFRSARAGRGPYRRGRSDVLDGI